MTAIETDGLTKRFDGGVVVVNGRVDERPITSGMATDLT